MKCLNKPSSPFFFYYLICSFVWIRIDDLFCFYFPYFMRRILVHEVHIDAAGPWQFLCINFTQIVSLTDFRCWLVAVSTRCCSKYFNTHFVALWGMKQYLVMLSKHATYEYIYQFTENLVIFSKNWYWKFHLIGINISRKAEVCNI